MNIAAVGNLPAQSNRVVSNSWHIAQAAIWGGSAFTITDISAWGWLERVPRVLPGEGGPLATFSNIDRWYRAFDARPAVPRAHAVGKDRTFKKEVDDETRRALFPSNYPNVA
jgi:GSH-dependent disulfide-bond oxidoreductase